MKFSVKVLLLASLATTVAFAQSQYVKNVIVVMQENRTPDNMFSQDQNLINAGADIIGINDPGIKCYTKQVPLQPLGLGPVCVDPHHNHNDSWVPMYDGGAMDGTCAIPVDHGSGSCNTVYTCPSGSQYTDCTQYAYVSDPVLQPYFQIAETYGWANYMFQTNQGPSFPAHQFLISGTSAPTGDTPRTPWYQYFAAENTPQHQGQNAGCAASTDITVPIISPSGDENTLLYPCYEHNTLVDLLDAKGVPWRYYSDQRKSIWTAPNAINHLCHTNGQGNGDPCQTADWNNDVILESKDHLSPFMSDLYNCNFTNWTGGVIFVVPDGNWSDHGWQNEGLGPDYVANIINLIEASPGCAAPKPNWNNTVVLVTWDDWGGWYDHVSPAPTTGPGIGYSNGTGKQYVYGFRVPLLVISGYVKQTSQNYLGYISNYQYDFGSILKFIEKTFSLGEINTTYDFADHFAGLRDHGDLSDFFDYTQHIRTFQQIPTVDTSQCSVDKCGQSHCNALCFIGYKGGPNDPDLD